MCLSPGVLRAVHVHPWLSTQPESLRNLSELHASLSCDWDTHTFPLLHLCPHALLQRIKSYCLEPRQISCCQRTAVLPQPLNEEMAVHVMESFFLSPWNKPVDQEDSHCSAKCASLRDPCSTEPLSIFFSFGSLDLNKNKWNPFRKPSSELEMSQSSWRKPLSLWWYTITTKQAKCPELPCSSFQGYVPVMFRFASVDLFSCAVHMFELWNKAWSLQLHLGSWWKHTICC